jgi:hypothetical protein
MYIVRKQAHVTVHSQGIWSYKNYQATHYLKEENAASTYPTISEAYEPGL